MAERFTIERKNIRFESGQIQSLGVLLLLFRGVWPMPAKTAMKADNHNKEGPINTTVSESVPNTQKHQSNKRPESKKF